MQRTTGAALIASLLVGSSLPALASSTVGTHATARRANAVSTAGWAATGTKAMLPANAIDLGSVPATMPMKIVVALRPNGAAAESALRHIYTRGDAQYHRFLTPQQYTAAFAPSTAQVEAVVAYLQHAGFSNVAASPNRTLVRAEASAAVVGSAFDTSIHGFNQGGRALYVNVSPAMVPQALAGVVSGVLGLQNAPMQLAARRATVRRAVVGPVTNPSLLCSTVGAAGGPCVNTAYRTNDLIRIYDGKTAPAGSLTNVAVFSEGDVSFIQSDLRRNEADEHLRPVPFQIVKVDLQSRDTYGQVEFDMDTQTSTGIAGDVKSLTMYNTGSLNDSDTTLAFNRWVTDNLATVASASFGECEYQAELDGAMAADDYVFQEAALQGQSIFVSTGDSGSSCGFNIVTNGTPGAGPPQLDYPAASPYAIGAGGTTLLTNTDGSYKGEIPWNAGGGGMSLFEPPEFWTEGVVSTQCLPAYCSIGGPGLPIALTGGMGRALPDVAMDADANLSGAQFYNNGSLTANGGTSLSAPLAMGVAARIATSQNNGIGFLAPAFYANYASNGGSFVYTSLPAPGSLTQPIGGFNDEVVGSNGLYTAKPGYDFTTGLGSFDINAIVNGLKSYTGV